MSYENETFRKGFNPPKGWTPSLTTWYPQPSYNRVGGFNPPKGWTPSLTGYMISAAAPTVGFNPPKGWTPSLTGEQMFVHTRWNAGFNPPKGWTPSLTYFRSTSVGAIGFNPPKGWTPSLTLFAVFPCGYSASVSIPRRGGHPR